MQNCECEVEHKPCATTKIKKNKKKLTETKNANDLFKQIKVKILPFFK